MNDGPLYSNIYAQQNRLNRQLEIRTERNIRILPHNNQMTIIVNPNDLTTMTTTTTTIRTDDPPSYHEAIVSPEYYDPPPPSYDLIYGRVIEAQQQSTSIYDFTNRLFTIFCGTISYTMVQTITKFIPVCLIIMGIVYLKDCPQGYFIPTVLLIGGIVAILKQLLSISVYVRHNEEDQNLERKRLSGTHRMMDLVMLCLFLVGSYFVYCIYEPNYDPSKGDYCNRTLYLFAFWMITIVYVILTLLIVCLLLVSMLTCILQQYHRPSNNV